MNGGWKRRSHILQICKGSKPKNVSPLLDAISAYEIRVFGELIWKIQLNSRSETDLGTKNDFSSSKWSN